MCAMMVEHDGPKLRGCWTAGRSSVTTASSWRMLRWMSDYAGLMRMLAADAGKVHSGCCELFELYFLHVFHVFGGVAVGDLVGGKPLRQASHLLHWHHKTLAIIARVSGAAT